MEETCSKKNVTHSDLSLDESYKILEKELLREGLQFLTREQIETDIDERKQKAKPWNSYHHSDSYPGMIVFPNTTEQVSTVVKLCNQYKVPLIPYGGGTSIEGQLTISTRGGVSLDFANMKKVLELNEEDLDCRVEAGMGYVELNEILKSKGLWFPLDPGPGATVGGMCACRCSGSTAVRYGSMRENVLNLTAVLADGSIIHTGSRARKCSAGYDITRLLIGSEGTLAVITEATLKLHGIPKVSYAVRIAFPGPDGVRNAALTAKDTLNCGVTIGRCELLDEVMINIVNFANPLNPQGPWPEHPTLMYEITGISHQVALEQREVVTRIAQKHGGTAIYTATSEEETKTFWKFRKECLWSAMSMYPDREAMITDVCVPLTKLADLIADTKLEIVKTGLPCPILAHAGDGNFHVLIFFKVDDPKEVAAAKALASTMALKAIALGGTCSGEHGIGVGKKEFLKKEMGENTIALMKLIKTTMDPQDILNPGKVLDIDRAAPLPTTAPVKACCSKH